MGEIIMGKKIMNEAEGINNEENKGVVFTEITSLRKNLNELYFVFTNIIHNKIDNGDLDITEYVETAKKIKIVEEQLSNLNYTSLNDREIEDSLERMQEDTQEKNIEKNESNEKNEDIQDLQSFGHSITETFLKTKPLGYKLLSDEMTVVKNWKDLYIKTCKQLLDLNPKLFKSFLDNPKMNWTTIKYYTKTKPQAGSFVEIEKGIYVNTLFGADEYMSMIRKMLEEYKIDIIEFRVFLKD